MPATKQQIDLANPEFQHIWDLVQNTHRSIFMTGKAGTGKSTFLKYICRHTRKKYVVLAPTGIAAVNVGGQTLHSFFKIPFKPLLPNDPEFAPRAIKKTLRYPRAKVDLIRKLDLIIIDEISMVRADVIDFIDKVLRTFSGNNREPFGGKQLLLVGDVFQLEPVVTRDMREILSRYYKQFFFFNARAFEVFNVIPIELRKVYRQSDNNFVSLLDRVRVNQATNSDVTLLNTRCNPDYKDNGEFVVTLATRRDTVDAINDEHMAALKTPEYQFEGEIEGDFPENDLPTARVLILKEGAQVIFIRNDKEGRWVNGTIGKVTQLSGTQIVVELETGDCYELTPDIWENVQYTFDEAKQVVVQNIKGSFQQYPIKPAWALTVHKSQGLTFNNVVIDFQGGAFTSGQTYVALSRCTSLEGITLLRPLSVRDIIVNSAIVDFSRHFNDQHLIDEAKKQEQARALYMTASVNWKHGEYVTALKSFIEANQLMPTLQLKSTQRVLAMKALELGKLQSTIKQLENVIDGQQKILHELAMEYTQMGRQVTDLVLASEEEELTSVVGEEQTPYGKGVADEIAINSALANFDKALRIWPECQAAMTGKALLLHRLDETSAAIALLKQANQLEPSSEVNMAMGQIYTETKHLPDAIKAYKRAIKADKNDPAPHQALSDLYRKMGLRELAMDHLEKAKKLINRQKRTTKQKKRSTE